MVNNAYENIYNIYRESSDVAGLKNFVTDYKEAPQFTEAWKLLFSLSVKSFSNEELEKFLAEHPAFPFKKSILKELELNKIQLYPFENKELIGFIDSTGKTLIAAEYDAASGFSEGLAVVNRNDSVFYINKENINPFNKFYNDAYVFKSGIAAVKEAGKWAFINRQGQIIKADYEEINELSEDIYIVKREGKYGATNHFGQIIIEPRFEKLGDFKNEFAYYNENGKYGFVSNTGVIHKPEFDWISDFSDKKNALFKQNNLFGIVNTNGEAVLPAEYDLILKGANNIYVVVKNNVYGFFNGSGCFMSQITYEFLKEKPAEFYTNGKAFKLIKKGQQGLIDGNGKQSIEFGAFDEINFASNDLIKVKRKNKYGFVDRKLSPVIPYKYTEATDFVDSLAIVSVEEENLIINTSGKTVFKSEEEIEKISTHYYAVGDEKRTIINSKGESLFTGVTNIQKIAGRLFAITLDNKEIKLLRD
jgi:hypothetical protein